MVSKSKNFGILINSFDIKAWQFEVIRQILDNTGFSLTLVILNNSQKKQSLKRKNALFHIYKRFFSRSPLLRRKNIRPLTSGAGIIQAITHRKGKYQEYFDEQTLEMIREENPAFLLRFGFGILSGDILNIPKFGVWSFHHGDEQKYRGGPYCFWEIFHNDPVTGIILQKLTETLDAGVILKKGFIKTISYSLGKNIEKTLQIAVDWPKQICKLIENKQFTIPDSASDSVAPIYHLPSNRQMFHFSLKIFKNKIKHIFNTLIFYDHWNVGFIPVSDNTKALWNLQTENIRWLGKPKKKSFIADPFVIQYNDKTYAAVEYFSYKTLKGVIQFYSGEDYQNEERAMMIEETHHLSFPNLFIDNGELYCLPESYESGNQLLYKFTGMQWEKHILIANVQFIDPELVFFNNTYFLFCTKKEDSHDTKLFIYFSDNLTGPFTSHPMNPVLCDVRKARAAGKIFFINEKMYRPGQDYSIQKEGSITISKIEELSKTAYSEITTDEILPLKNIKYSHKIHTINFQNDHIIFDACIRKTFIKNPFLFFKYFLKKIKN